MKSLTTISAFLALLCSFYGEAFRGLPTASGELYDPSALTAASRKFPLGSKLRISAEGHSVIVRVNDRISKRYADRLDLSPAAFKQLAPLDRGLVEANVTLIP